MKKQRGFTVIELVVSFVLISIIVIGMLTIALNYRGDAQLSIEKLAMERYKDTLTKKIQTDINEYGVEDIQRCSTSPNTCLNIKFGDGTSRTLELKDDATKKERYIKYDGQRFVIEEISYENTSINFPSEINFTQETISGTNKIYKINISIYHYDIEGDFGITIIATNRKFDENPDYPLLIDVVKQGDYVAYEGNNGCMKNGTPVTGTGEAESGNSCLGDNANDTVDNDSAAYGYCHDSAYKFRVKGWRIAYTDDSHAYLISAGSPECNARTLSTGNSVYVIEANQKAIKYCNLDFVDGVCDSTNAWAIGDNDFNKITSQLTGTPGGYLFIPISGTTRCGDNTSGSVCSYNNNLFDNGGYYWFASVYDPYRINGVSWNPVNHFVNGENNGNAYGLRPVIRLSSSIYVTGGTGTMDDPYRIIKK